MGENPKQRLCPESQICLEISDIADAQRRVLLLQPHLSLLEHLSQLHNLHRADWIHRVIPSPMSLFIKRDSDGRTLIGGYTCRLWSCLSM